jgi:Primase X
MGEKLDGAHPTVLWLGNGYHIYQPMEARFPLEQNETFSKFNQPSVQFLRFAEQYLSNHSSDSSHNPSFKSCMIRIPGSFNSKCVSADTDMQVKIVQRWNGYRPKISLLLGSFYAYLVDQEITESKSQKELNKYYLNKASSTTTLWIEKLLKTPIDDYRKDAVSLILAPYLINVKKVSYDAALNIINSWLSKCGELRQLDQNFDYTVRYALKYSTKNGHKPIKYGTLKLKNTALYDLLNS